jgi:O-antigen/teichoic acid export membrane protein
MSLTRKIAGHTLIQLVGRLSGNIIGVIIVALLTRYLGTEGFGNYTTILAYLFFFSALADLGLYMITINEVNKDADRRRFLSAVYSLRFFSAITLMIAAGLLIWLFPYPPVVKYGVLIISLSILFSLLDQIQVAFYQAELKMVRPAIADVVGKIILIIGVLMGIKLNISLFGILWLLVAGHGAQFFINLIGVRRIVKLSIRPDKHYWKKIISKSWPIALSQIFVLIYFKMDTIFLSLLRPQNVAQIEVGLYGAPYKILEVLVALVPLFMGLVAPILAWALSQNLMDRFRDMYQKTFDALSIITLPLVVGGIVLAEPIMQLLAPGFIASVDILRILMVATGIIYFAHLPGYTIVTLNQQKKLLKYYVLAAILAVVLYISLIPYYSFYAAAGITVFIEALVLWFTSRRVKQVISYKTNWTTFAKALLASLVMAIVLRLAYNWNIFILLALGTTTYGLVIFLIKGVSREMLQKIISARGEVDKI